MLPPLDLDLTFNQQAALRHFEFQIDKLTAEEMRPLFLSLLKQLMVRENVMRQLMKLQ